MIRTVQDRDHRLWAKLVRREVDAKRRFEFLTGQTDASKFFNGQNQRNVQKGLKTFQSTLDNDGLKQQTL